MGNKLRFINNAHAHLSNCAYALSHTFKSVMLTSDVHAQAYPRTSSAIQSSV
jgi:hypothetical protein